MNVEKRIEIEKKVVRKLVREMKAAGWEATQVNDGEEIVKTRTEAEVIDTVFSVDESHIRFKKQRGDGEKMVRSAFIVLGNDGWDCIADHSVSKPEIPEDDFEKIMDEVIYPYCEKLELES